MRIGILTFHRAYNCGAMLQAWALMIVLERMGHMVAFPRCNNVGYIPTGPYCFHIPKEKKGLMWWRSLFGRLWLDVRGVRQAPVSAKYYNEFRERHLPEKSVMPADFSLCFDCVVVGSDQVFNTAICGKYLPVFYGESISKGIGKIVYAGSAGDTEKSSSDLERFCHALKGFDSVSLREPFQDYDVVTDPTLLLSSGDYDVLLQDSDFKNKICGDYVYLYSTDATDFEVSSARKIAKALGCSLVISPVYPRARTRIIPECDEELSPVKMLHYIRNAKYVIAGSFHGTALALIHKKPFLCIRNKIDEKESRPSFLLNRIGMDERLVNPSVEIAEMVSRIVKPFSPCALNNLKAWQEQSLAWLSMALAKVQIHG